MKTLTESFYLCNLRLYVYVYVQPFIKPFWAERARSGIILFIFIEFAYAQLHNFSK